MPWAAARVKDRVFCAVGQVVVGLGRKGKQFFSLQSSLVEPIRFLSVDEALLFTGGEYAHSRYKDGADDGFYRCPDRITAMHVQRFQDQHHVFLGCKDRRIRMVQRDELIGEISTERPASALTVREVTSLAYELVVGDEGRFYKLLPLQGVDAQHEGGLVNQWRCEGHVSINFRSY